MIEELVKRIPFFSKLGTDELRDIVKIGQARHVASNQLLFKQGDPGDYMYVIVAGRVGIYCVAEDEEVVLSTFKEGAFFGEMALIDGGPRSASVRTLTACHLFLLGRKDFLDLLARSSHILSDVMRGLTAKLRVLGQDFVVTSLQKRHIEDQAEIERHRAISQMVAGVAHEINTPIAIASQGAMLISEALTPAVIATLAADADTIEVLNDVVDAAELVQSNLLRADKLVGSFKKLSVRQIADSVESVDLGEIVDEIIVLCAAQTKSWKLQIDVIDQLDDDRLWEGYPGYLTQVLINLITNAQTHAYPGGGSGSVQIVLTKSAMVFSIEVKDFGCGIRKGDLNRVFTAFYTTRRGEGGSGLGMTIAHSLVTNALRGAIEIESELGRGTSVTIRFPKRLESGEVECR